LMDAASEDAEEFDSDLLDDAEEIDFEDEIFEEASEE